MHGRSLWPLDTLLLLLLPLAEAKPEGTATTHDGQEEEDVVEEAVFQ